MFQTWMPLPIPFRPGLSLLILLACLLWLSACGGGSGGSTVTADATAVDTGKPVRVDTWEAELLKPPEKVKVVGQGDITYQADGSFLVVFVKITNHSDALQLVARDLFSVHDDEGNAYAPVRSAVQVAYVLQHGMQILFDSPLPVGQPRDGVVIFDVPDSATGLSLVMKGSQEALRLGF